MSRGRILVIEDEAIVADDIVYCLEEAGYEVPAVCSAGENALEFLDTNTADLALVDILLDGEMDGIETARKRASERVVKRSTPQVQQLLR